MTEFTPMTALAGGALIGLAAVMLMGALGRIAGICGMFSGAIFAEHGDRLWRAAFLAGLIGGPLLYAVFAGRPDFEMTASWPAIVFGGAAIGFGARLAAGCTSGHGVCGVSRLSPRSFAALGVFLGVGMGVATLLRLAGAG